MKTSYIFAITLIFITLVFIFASENFNSPTDSARHLEGAALRQQISAPTPNGVDLSEVGSTDGIIVMGFVLVTIAILPVVFHKRKKITQQGEPSYPPAA